MRCTPGLKLMLKLRFLAASWKTPFLPGAAFSYHSLIQHGVSTEKFGCICGSLQCLFQRTQASTLVPKLLYDPDAAELFG